MPAEIRNALEAIIEESRPQIVLEEWSAAQKRESAAAHICKTKGLFWESIGTPPSDEFRTYGLSDALDFPDGANIQRYGPILIQEKREKAMQENIVRSMASFDVALLVMASTPALDVFKVIARFRRGRVRVWSRASLSERSSCLLRWLRSIWEETPRWTLSSSISKKKRRSSTGSSLHSIPEYPQMVEALVTALPFDSAAEIRVIDLGCGTGTVALAVLRAFPRAHVTCLDLAENMIVMAKSKLANYQQVHYVVGDFGISPGHTMRSCLLLPYTIFQRKQPNGVSTGAYMIGWPWRCFLQRRRSIGFQ